MTAARRRLQSPTGTTDRDFISSNPMRGHVIIDRGAAHDPSGQRLAGPQWTGSGGPGCAKCTCGEVSEEFPARRARYRWIQEHRAALVAAAGTQEAPGEEWREVSIDPRYAVSSLGRVRGALGFLLSQAQDRDGYLMLTIGTRANQKVHQLVCTAFHGPRPSPTHEVAHGSGVRDDNRAENLRWATRSENSRDAVEHGTNVGLVRRPGELHSRARFTWEQVDEIRALAAGGMSNAEIGRAFGVGRSTIRPIVQHQTWHERDRPRVADQTRERSE